MRETAARILEAVVIGVLIEIGRTIVQNINDNRKREDDGDE